MMTKQQDREAAADAAGQPEQTSTVRGRRAFFGKAGAATLGGALVASGQALAQSDGGIPDVRALGESGGDLNQQLRRQTFRLRVERAKANYDQAIPNHQNNGDEERYANKIGSDTRGLPHNARGEVDLKAWGELKAALATGLPADFEKVTLGGGRKLVNPVGTLSLNLTGLGPNQIAIPPAPALASQEKAAEAVEIYWQSLLRDVPFSEYRDDTHNELVRAAAAELSRLPGYAGPRNAEGKVTPSLLFRGTARYVDPSDPSGRKAKTIAPVGVLVGPYISQFLLRDVPYGLQSIPGTIRAQLPGNDFLLNPEELLANISGQPHKRVVKLDSKLRYLSTGRDLAEYSRGGAPGFWAASQILSNPRSSDPLVVGGIGAPLAANNPYLKYKVTQSANASFGAPFVQSLIPLATTREIRANYWQKWFVHRVPRPEAISNLAHQRLAKGISDIPLHDDFLKSDALSRSHAKHGVHLLSHAYPDGAPYHSSYPGGASSAAAIHATLLKAFFDESFVISDPVQPDPNDPTKLIPYVGPPLTVGGELNKLASNLGWGRNWGGIHFRSDAGASLPQAEELALSLLRDERYTFRENFEGFTLTRFDGSKVTI
jgi:hypothetical protein